MTFDPFASAPTETAQPEPTSVPDTVPMQVEAPIYRDPDAFVATFKAGAGYDAPWLVVRGATGAELADRVKQAGADDLFGLVAKAAAHFAKMAPNKPAGGVVSQQAPNAVPERPANVPAHYVFKSGISKAGKPYKMWTDPNDRDAKPIWHN